MSVRWATRRCSICSTYDAGPANRRSWMPCAGSALRRGGAAPASPSFRGRRRLSVAAIRPGDARLVTMRHRTPAQALRRAAARRGLALDRGDPSLFGLGAGALWSLGAGDLRGAGGAGRHGGRLAYRLACFRGAALDSAVLDQPLARHLAAE